jgi:hypothetical protein
MLILLISKKIENRIHYWSLGIEEPDYDEDDHNIALFLKICVDNNFGLHGNH